MINAVFCIFVKTVIMAKIYKELNVVEDGLEELVSEYDLQNFIDDERVLAGIEKVSFGGFYKLDDAFGLLVDNGWRYVSTYWRPTGVTQQNNIAGIKVLTFIK